MSQQNEQPTGQSTNKGGQQPALDDLKRQRIVGMLVMGSSRREAAKAVGVHPATIGRTMARDPEFQKEIIDGEMLGRQRPLKAMFLAVEKHWRAAAWMLERRCPDEFGRRQPKTYTHGEVREMVDRLLAEALPMVPAESDREEITLIADRYVEKLEKPSAGKSENPLLEMEKMGDEAEAYRQAKADAELAEQQKAHEELQARREKQRAEQLERQTAEAEARREKRQRSRGGA